MFDPLLLLFFAPLIAAFFLFAMVKVSSKWTKAFAAICSMVPLFILILTPKLLGRSYDVLWFKPLSIHFNLSIDSLTLIFLYLTALITPIAIITGPIKNLSHPNIFYGFILFLQALLIGFFSTKDLALFTIFWEAMLIPLYFIINIWGGKNRQFAAMQFLLYMIAGSALLVFAVIALYFAASSFNFDELAKLSSTMPYAGWYFFIFLVAFAVKTPLFPFHGWLIDTYCEAPKTATILLAALLSKAGIYGVIRILMGIFPLYMQMASPYVVCLAVIGVLYGALAALAEIDMKRLIAYSSFSHVNFIFAALFVWNGYALAGGLFQVVTHSIVIAALFIIVGYLIDWLKTSDMQLTGGLARKIPAVCWLTLFFIMANVSLPGTANFVGELLVLFGVFQMSWWVAAILGLSVIVSATYALRFQRKVFFGQEGVATVSSGIIDVRLTYFAVIAPLVIATLWLGIYPRPLLELIEPVVKQIHLIDLLEH